MENLVIEKTDKTPQISFQASSGKLEVMGRSIPEDSLAFYRPLYTWLDSYAETAPQEVFVTIEFDYFNTSSAKCILDFLKKIKNIQNAGKNVAIQWFHENGDVDMEESIDDFRTLLNIDIEIITR
jgi:hypothetical protein